MRPRRTSVPSRRSSLSSVPNSPEIPESPQTPNVRKRKPAFTSPEQPVTSPFPARTPRTPGLSASDANATSCTSNESLFTIVKVHTAKCTECDKRNMDTMRRCPGCTFQVCKPCYDRRQKDGRGLMHGNSPSGAITPTTGPRMVRRKVTSTIEVPIAEEAKSGEQEEVEAQSTTRKARQKSTPASKSPAKKRALRSKTVVKNSTTEESSSNTSGDGLSPDSTSSMPNKRRRITVTSHGSPHSLRTPVESASASSSSAPKIPNGSTPSAGVRLGSLDIDGLMRVFGVNTPENPYHEHPLRRREPVMSNPVIKIPEIVKRGFKPRIKPEEIQRKIQENTLKRIQQTVLDNLAAEREAAEKAAYSFTVRSFVENEAVKYQDHAQFDVDENEALLNAIKEGARKWSNTTWNSLQPDTQRMVRKGLDMRLDLIDSSHKEMLTKLIETCASQKLQEFAENKG